MTAYRGTGWAFVLPAVLLLAAFPSVFADEEQPPEEPPPEEPPEQNQPCEILVFTFYIDFSAVPPRAKMSAWFRSECLS